MGLCELRMPRPVGSGMSVDVCDGGSTSSSAKSLDNGLSGTSSALDELAYELRYEKGLRTVCGDDASSTSNDVREGEAASGLLADSRRRRSVDCALAGGGSEVLRDESGRSVELLAAAGGAGAPALTGVAMLL